jgi:meso-butanediol dehydrogenase / (S,S)-butanediol dehydrogenase / diacetyl reductase
MTRKGGQFTGKRVLISGGGTGIGRSLALAFAEEGGEVCIVGRKESSLAEVAAAGSDGIRFTVCDVADEKRWREIVAEERPDVLINNAAISMGTDLFGETDPSWETIFAINLQGTLSSCREAAKFMRERGSGRIVNITSVHGRICEKGSAAYGVAKAAVDQLTRCLAVELGPYGILVNAVAPGFVDTPMSRASGENELETEWFRRNFVENRRIPLGRAAQPEEMVGAVFFFAGSSNTYVTGQVLAVDGGLTLTL